MNPSGHAHEFNSPNPETSTGENRLERLNPEELLPPSFDRLRGVVGTPRLLIDKRDPLVLNFIIVDEERRTESQLIDEMKYPLDMGMPALVSSGENDGSYPRPLVHGSLRHASAQNLYIDLLELHPVLRNQKAGTLFQEHLGGLAKKLGYRFMTGSQHDAKTAQFFFKNGRYLLEEIREDLQGEFLSDKTSETRYFEEEVFLTIKFLDLEDIDKWVRSERVGTSIEDKIALKRRVQDLCHIFRLVRAITERISNREGLPLENDDVARQSMMDTITTLQNFLPESQRQEFSPPAHDHSLASLLSTSITQLEQKRIMIAERAPADQLNEILSQLTDISVEQRHALGIVRRNTKGME